METMLTNLKTAISKVMETMFFLLPDEASVAGCTVYIGVTGSPNYILMFLYDYTLAVTMAKNLLGINETEINEEIIEECAKETANIIAGNFLLSFVNDEKRNITLPRLNRREVYGDVSVLETNKFTVSFEGQTIEVTVETVEKI